MKKSLLTFVAKIACFICFTFFSISGKLLAFDDSDPNFGDDCKSFSSVIGTLEYLILKPCADDLDFALKSSQDIATKLNPYGKAQCETLDPGWKSGYRLSVGKSCVFREFGLSIDYMYLKGDKAKSVAKPDGGSLIPTMIHLGNVPENTFNADNAHGKWSLRFQKFDVLVNHPYCYSECLELTPYFGAEGLIIHQMIKSRFVEAAKSMKSRWESDYFGVGIVAGFCLDWYFCPNFSFFTDVSLRIIRGTNDTDDHIRIDLDVDSFENNKLRNSACLFVPGYQIRLGLSFAQNIWNKILSVDVGYEFIDFLNMPNPRRFISGGDSFPVSTSPISSGVGFHGTFLSMTISF